MDRTPTTARRGDDLGDSAPDQDSHTQIDPPILYVGTPVALVTTMSPDGSANIGPMSSAWVLGRTIVLGWSTASQTLANLEREGECVVNYPGAEHWRQVDAIALLTGRQPVPEHKASQFSYSPDKWAPGGFTPQASRRVRPPRIAECAIQCEAEVQSITVPSGPGGEQFRIVETWVRAVHADRRIVVPGTDRIDTAQWSPTLYVFRDYFGTGPRRGTSTRR